MRNILPSAPLVKTIEIDTCSSYTDDIIPMLKIHSSWVIFEGSQRKALKGSC